MKQDKQSSTPTVQTSRFGWASCAASDGHARTRQAKIRIFEERPEEKHCTSVAGSVVEAANL